MNVLDTYALIEIKRGNPSYAPILQSPFLITDLTIGEFYIVIMREENEEEAKKWLGRLKVNCRPVSREILINGLKFRESRKRENLSIFDSVGYQYARWNDFLFVTGDKAFKEKEGVLFIPASS